MSRPNSPLRVYFAAPYSTKETMRVYAEELRARDIIVTSSWLEETEKPSVQLQEVSEAKNREYALRDVQDVSAADILVLWTDPTKKIIRQGRTAELGVAVGIGLTRVLPIFIIGNEYENIFHYLPQVTRFSTWDEARQRLFELSGIV